MNHARIAQQALHYRNAMVVDSFTAGRFDPAAVATVAVECGDPIIDSAIRRIGTAWIRGGLQPEQLIETWSGPLVDQIFADDPTLLDAIDDIIRTVHRVQFSRPRGGVVSRHPAHRPGTTTH
jgi:hypothetical protein